MGGGMIVVGFMGFGLVGAGASCNGAGMRRR